MKTLKFRDSTILKVETWIYAICLLCSIPPFFFWKLDAPYFMFVCLVISLRHIRLSRDTGYVVFSTLLFVLYLIFAFLSAPSFQRTVLTCFMGVIFFTDVNFMKAVFEKFVYVFSITSAVSIVQFVLVEFFDIGMPHRVLGALNTMKTYNYIAYMFFVIPSHTMDLIPRFCGMYDEPGVVGTIAGAVLMIRKFNFKEWINVPIFIAGILSFSLFFYVIFAVYVILFAKIKYKIVVAILASVAIYMWYDDGLLGQYIFRRLEIENGELVGDNRAQGAFDYWYANKFVNSEDFYFGLGRGSSLVYNRGGASYKDIIVNYGIVFFVAYMAIFVLFGLYRLRLSKNFFLYMVVLFGVIYQRPFIDSMIYLFIIFIPILYLGQPTVSTDNKRISFGH